jgi:hypothetical protein
VSEFCEIRCEISAHDAVLWTQEFGRKAVHQLCTPVSSHLLVHSDIVRCFNAQGALLKSERCVMEYIFEVLLFLLFEKIPTQNQRSMKENKQQQRRNRSYNQNRRICNKGWNMTSHGRYVTPLSCGHSSTCWGGGMQPAAQQPVLNLLKPTSYHQV